MPRHVDQPIRRGQLRKLLREGGRYAYMDPAELGGIMFEFVERTAN
jgi:hypothetical protein